MNLILLNLIMIFLLNKFFQLYLIDSEFLLLIINQIYNILQLPCYEDSYDSVIGETYKADPKAFHQIVREFVKIYAPK